MCVCGESCFPGANSEVEWVFTVLIAISVTVSIPLVNVRARAWVFFFRLGGGGERGDFVPV